MRSAAPSEDFKNERGAGFVAVGAGRAPPPALAAEVSRDVAEREAKLGPELHSWAVLLAAEKFHRSIDRIRKLLRDHKRNQLEAGIHVVVRPGVDVNFVVNGLQLATEIGDVAVDTGSGPATPRPRASPVRPETLAAFEDQGSRRIDRRRRRLRPGGVHGCRRRRSELVQIFIAFSSFSIGLSVDTRKAAQRKAAVRRSAQLRAQALGIRADRRPGSQAAVPVRYRRSQKRDLGQAARRAARFCQSRRCRSVCESTDSNLK